MSTADLATQKIDLSLAAAQEAANHGPLVLTDETGPSHVLLSIADYERLLKGQLNILELLWMPGTADIEFDPQRSTETVRHVDF